MSESVGAQLRAAREARGWSVDEVAGRLRIPARYVNALEAGDAAALPEPTFVRGYVKAYAKALALDADALLAAVVQIEVKAPRPLIGPEGQAGASRRASAPMRGPSFRSGSSRRYRVAGAAALLVAAVVWLAWPDGGHEAAAPKAAVPAAPVAAPVVQPAVTMPSPVTGGVTLAVPLPGTAAPSPAAPAAPAVAGASPAANPASPPVAVTTKLPGVATTAATPPAVATTAAVVAPVTAAAPVAPRKGLFARFSGTCWLEVRDADNVVIHTRIAMAGNEVSVDGKAPLTVTLGDASAAEVWYNGDRVAADKFSSNGIARIIVGQSAR